MNVFSRLAHLAGIATLVFLPLWGLGSTTPAVANLTRPPVTRLLSKTAPGLRAKPAFPPSETEGDSDSTTVETPPSQQLNDIIEFPDNKQVPYAGGHTDVASSAPFVRDHCNLFDRSKISEWEQKSAKLAQRYGIAPYIVTVDSFQNHSPDQWLADYYNANKLGLGSHKAHGVIMVINPVSRDVRFLGHGDGQSAFTSYEISKLYARIKQPLGENNWNEGGETYLRLVADDLEQWKNATISDPNYEDPNYEPLQTEGPNPTVAGIGASVAIGVGSGALVMGILKAKHRTARQQQGAAYYIVPNASRISEASDDFVRTYTTSVQRPKSSSHSHGGRGSFHSGGTSFSSGGGKF